MDKIWLASYPAGVPAEVDVEAYDSISEVLARSVERFRTRPAFSNLGATLTYGELDERSRAFAAYLQQELGLTPGERLAIMLPNVMQYPVALFGALRAGLVVTNVNPLYTPRELRHQLTDSGAQAIVILENFGHVLAEVIAGTPVRAVITTRLGDLLGSPKGAIVNFVVKYLKRMVKPFRLPGAVRFPAALAAGARHTPKPVATRRTDLAFLQYTAGTTGVAKGVMLTHGNIIANLQQASGWVGQMLREGEEVVVTPLPLYHIFSLTANCLMFMKLGGCIYLITNPRDFKHFVGELRKLRFTVITGVNTLYRALLNTPGFAQVDFSTLKLALGGGMAVQGAVAAEWQRVTGHPLLEAYGLTEASPGVCINPIDLAAYNGKIGLPIPSTECSIQDEDGRELPPGETGELCVRGPQVMRGYWQRPEQTAKVLKADGWLHTGDIGAMDERGFIQIFERKDDLINVSGFNVYPTEIEDVVVRHPGVLEAAAIGVPDPHSGHTVKLFVVRKDPALTAETLHDYCEHELTRYKLPKHIVFCDSLPKSPVGKVLRRELR
jgi:long-chain acyl-CoA synthetase